MKDTNFVQKNKDLVPVEVETVTGKSVWMVSPKTAEERKLPLTTSPTVQPAIMKKSSQNFVQTVHFEL
jgi:hypothetical protein